MSDVSHYEVIWSDMGTSDFEAVLDYIAERNPGRANELLQQLKKHIETLSVHPERCRLVPETMAIGLDIYRELILNPYRAVFRIRGKRVHIMGFFDGRRDLQDILFDRLARS